MVPLGAEGAVGSEHLGGERQASMEHHGGEHSQEAAQGLRARGTDGVPVQQGRGKWGRSGQQAPGKE